MCDLTLSSKHPDGALKTFHGKVGSISEQSGPGLSQPGRELPLLNLKDSVPEDIKLVARFSRRMNENNDNKKARVLALGSLSSRVLLTGHNVGSAFLKHWMGKTTLIPVVLHEKGPCHLHQK